MSTMIEQVQEIDQKAAQWLMDNLPDPERDRPLSCAMVWSETPQGIDYWRHIADRIECGYRNARY